MKRIISELFFCLLVGLFVGAVAGIGFFGAEMTAIRNNTAACIVPHYSLAAGGLAGSIALTVVLLILAIGAASEAKERAA